MHDTQAPELQCTKIATAPGHDCLALRAAKSRARNVFEPLIGRLMRRAQLECFGHLHARMQAVVEGKQKGHGLLVHASWHIEKAIAPVVDEGLFDVGLAQANSLRR